MQTQQSMAAFAKMHGLGNQIFIADLRDFPLSTTIDPTIILRLAQDEQSKFDQMMVIYQADDYIIKIYNADASLAGACGNGMRCVTKYLHTQTGQNIFKCRTKSGLLLCEYRDKNNIFISMGQPNFSSAALGLTHEIADTSAVSLRPDLPPAFLVSMGNPHAIFFMDELPALPRIKQLGEQLEKHAIFNNRCNISFAKVLDKHNIKLYTWERGAGLTQACGSAACASFVAAAKTGACTTNAHIHCLGGILEIAWQEGQEVRLGGAAKFEFSGKFNINNGEFELCPPK